MKASIDILIDGLHTGGVEKIALSQVVSLNEVGTKSSLYVLRRTDLSEHPFDYLIKKVNIVFLDDRLPSFMKISFKFPFFSFFSLHHLTYPILLPFVLKNNEFEGLVVHGTYTALTALSFRIFRGARYHLTIWDPIGYILKKAYSNGPISFLNPILVPLGAFFDWLLVLGAQGVLVGGQPHIEYLKGLGAKKVEILYPGVHTEKQVAAKKEDYILAVTAWKEGKKPEFNLDILEKCPDLKLVMAGSWYPKELQSEFVDIVKARGLSERCQVTGSVTEDGLKELYSKALVFLQTNDDRGFGMPALEAAACGTTFIIPQGQGVCELFEDKVDGFYTKERDTSDIIEKIQMLYQDKDLAKKMGKSAWEKVVKNYSWERHAQKLIEVVE